MGRTDQPNMGTDMSSRKARYRENRGGGGASNLGAGGSTRRWRAVRAAVLAEEPVCRICGVAPSSEVDHIIERQAGGDDRRENLRGVCPPCHAGRAARRRRAEPSQSW